MISQLISGCGTVVDYMPYDNEVMGWNPARILPFPFILYIYLFYVSSNWFLYERHHN